MSVPDPDEPIELNVSLDAWYDLWHTHVDWEGEGNADASVRLSNLGKLFRIFESIRKQVQRLSVPANVWLLFVPEEAGDDSVYVHTPNPNGSPFPYPFEGVSWGVSPPPALRQFVQPEFEFGYSDYSGKMFWVRVRNAT